MHCVSDVSLLTSITQQGSDRNLNVADKRAVHVECTGKIDRQVIAIRPDGKEVIDQLMRGEILTADTHDFETIAISYGLVALCFYVYQRDILLVSFDRELALVMGKPVRRYDGLMLAMIGVTVTVGVLIVGPVVLFGQLVMPPLAANAVARSMRSFYVIAMALGVDLS